MDKMMSEFINDKNVFFKSLQMNKTGLRGAKLNNPSLIKFKSLEDFLAQLLSFKQRISDDLKEKIPVIESLRKQCEDTHKKYNEVIARKDKYSREFNKLKELLLENETNLNKSQQNQDDLREKLKNTEITLSLKKNELKQSMIPGYGLIIADKLKRIENEEIPQLEHQITEYIRNIGECASQEVRLKHLITDLRNKLIEKENELSKTHEELDEYEVILRNISYDIIQKVKNLAYLTTLEMRIVSAVSEGTKTQNFKEFLDLEPGIIQFKDENIYFDLIEKWAQTKDDKVIEEFYMEAEKEFFNQNVREDGKIASIDL